MPTLDFKGKSFVYTHHLSVPFRELIVDAKKSELPAGAKPSLEDNLIIHGDNLHALKALLPIYAGKVDCIYIDPPYNTGNEGWCYNDNVRSPLMKEWLKKSANPVEKDDLERHEKWLCMMWPRLKLLHELLAEDGAIFISIDDNEVHRLRDLMDEIFGEDNFVTQIEWQKRYTRSNNTDAFTTMTEHMVVYQRSGLFAPNLFARDAGADARYENPDKDPRGPWKAIPFLNPLSPKERPNLVYSIRQPNTGEELLPTKNAWRASQEAFERFSKDKRVWWGGDGKSRIPNIKNFLSEAREGMTPINFWDHRFAGNTDDANEELKQIFGDKAFPTPKPSLLIRRVLEVATNKNSLVLDSFAGSGTTAHAVIALNKKDDGNRKFILVEMEDYADKLTAERVRRVINGYKFEGTQREELLREPITLTALKNAGALLEKANSFDLLDKHRFDRIAKSVEDGALVVTGEKKVTEKVEGLGGSFTFCTLGEEMSMDRLLAGDRLPSFDALAKYVFYTATGRTLADVPKQKADGDGFIAETEFYRVHLFYKPEKKWLASNDAALTEQLVEKMLASNKEKKRLLVFAAAKFMSQKELTRQGVEFCQLPYAIHRIMGD
jgi:adenine-specific DNA-methyltransferase